MIGSGLGAEKEVAFKIKRLKGLKGKVRRMGKEVFPANFVVLFVNIVSVQ